MKIKTISVAALRAELLNELNQLADDDQVGFGTGDLTFFRPKDIGPVNGPRIVLVQFNELYSVHSMEPEAEEAEGDAQVDATPSDPAAPKPTPA